MRLINKGNTIKRCTICFTDLTIKEVGVDIGNCYVSNYKNKIYKCNSCFITHTTSYKSNWRKSKTVGSPQHLTDLIHGARARARKFNLPFNLKERHKEQLANLAIIRQNCSGKRLCKRKYYNYISVSKFN